jgi:hypothetical protein
MTRRVWMLGRARKWEARRRAGIRVGLDGGFGRIVWEWNCVGEKRGWMGFLRLGGECGRTVSL